jgi:hypothetical protein
MAIFTTLPSSPGINGLQNHIWLSSKIAIALFEDSHSKSLILDKMVKIAKKNGLRARARDRV